MSTLDEIRYLPPAVQTRRFLEERIRREEVVRDRELMGDSLIEYMKGAWRIIEPSTSYLHNWHIEAIAEHLDACVAGDIRNLLVTMPPRHMKSILISVGFPTWLWITAPETRFLFSSYAATLSIRDSLKSRRIIQSPWYQDRWGDVFHLTGDQNAKVRYENDRGGYRIATSVGGAATGEGGDYVVSDDPHNLEEINSDVIREGVIEWWDHVMSTRLNDPKRGVKIVVMQRGHEADLAGHALKQAGWAHLNLPAEFELDRKKTSIGWSDPRKEKGELLWPARFGRKEIDELKAVLGPYGAAAQLQQRPAPEEGGIFKRPWFKLWPNDVKIPPFHFVIQSYDTAFTEKTHSDESACTVWGIFKHPKTKNFCAILADAWNERLDYPDLRKKVKAGVYAKYGEKDEERKVDVVLVESKGSGITLLQDLRMIGVPAYGYNPNKADKIVRAHAAAPLLFSGLVYLPESGKSPGHPVSWASSFVHEMLTFPNAASDNYVDTFTQAMLLMRNKEMLVAKVGGFEDENETPLPPLVPAVNPYAM